MVQHRTLGRSGRSRGVDHVAEVIRRHPAAETLRGEGRRLHDDRLRAARLTGRSRDLLLQTLELAISGIEGRVKVQAPARAVSVAQRELGADQQLACDQVCRVVDDDGLERGLCGRGATAFEQIAAKRHPRRHMGRVVLEPFSQHFNGAIEVAVPPMLFGQLESQLGASLLLPSTFQIREVPSSEPVTIRTPSGLNAMARTGPSCCAFEALTSALYSSIFFFFFRTYSLLNPLLLLFSSSCPLP